MNQSMPEASTRRARRGTANATSSTPAEPAGKLGLLVGLLRRPEGATMAHMAAATGWQDHSIRGALAGALKKRNFCVASQKVDGVRTYRLDVPEPAPAATRAPARRRKPRAEA